ncbi:glycerophosphodiester phosphodiesterase [Rhodobacterales bacterium]|nr:glycerophosphodiester phosphodiesterase [Rhodobacterales bacterium]
MTAKLRCLIHCSQPRALCIAAEGLGVSIFPVEAYSCPVSHRRRKPSSGGRETRLDPWRRFPFRTCCIMTAFVPDRRWIHDHVGPPLSIAHRGASAHAPDNTLAAFEKAHELGADMWEVDIRLTADGVPVAFHDADLLRLSGDPRKVADVSADELFALTAASGRQAPDFAEVARLAAKTGAGIYLDAKENRAASAAIDILIAYRIERVIIGANTPEDCAERIASGSSYPVSLLVGLGADPFELAGGCGAEIVHPCWERAGDRPDLLLDESFFRTASRLGLPVVTWHEERADVIAALVEMPLLGICSDTPEQVSQYRRPKHVAP